MMPYFSKRSKKSRQQLCREGRQRRRRPPERSKDETLQLPNQLLFPRGQAESFLGGKGATFGETFVAFLLTLLAKGLS